MVEQHETFMKMAIAEAKNALQEGDHPFGGILVKEGQVLARGRNMVETTYDVTAHAETMALRKA